MEWADTEIEISVEVGVNVMNVFLGWRYKSDILLNNGVLYVGRRNSDRFLYCPAYL